MKKVSVVLILVVVLVAILAACSTTPSPTTTSAPTTTSTQTTTSAQPATSAPATLTPQYGGVLKLVVRNPSNYFGYNGDMSSSGAVEVSHPCLEQLVQLDARGKFTPTGLVTAYQVAPDGQSITFILRKGVKFHDGIDFNAQVVKWSLEWGMKMRLSGTELFTSVEAVDDYTLRINAKNFDNRVLKAVADTKVSSPAAFDKYGRSEISTHPVGTGPFKFVSFTPDIGVTWERFDDYWGGKPYLDGIQSLFIADDMARMAALQSGDVDILFNVNPQTALSLKTKGYAIATGISPQMWVLMPDSVNENSPLSKLPVRQAAEYAINRDELAKLGSGFWEATYQPSTPTSPGYIPDFKGRQYDVSKAKELLAQAGYSNGFDIAIIFDQAKGIQDPMVAIQQMLSMIGIKVDVQPVTGNQRTNYSRNGFQNGFITQNIYCGPIEYLPGLNYAIGPDGPMHVSTARPPGYKEAMNGAFTADEDGFDAAARKVNMVLHDNASFIPLWVDPMVIYATPNYVHDAHIFETANTFSWTPAKAWLSKK